MPRPLKTVVNRKKGREWIAARLSACSGVYCSPAETLLPQRALLPHNALLPQRALLPHKALLPHSAFDPQRALLHHSALLPQRALLAATELLAETFAEPELGTNCIAPHTDAFDQVEEVFHTVDGLSVRYTLFVLELNVAVGDIAVPVAMAVLFSAASTST